MEFASLTPPQIVLLRLDSAGNIKTYYSDSPQDAVNYLLGTIGALNFQSWVDNALPILKANYNRFNEIAERVPANHVRTGRGPTPLKSEDVPDLRELLEEPKRDYFGG